MKGKSSRSSALIPLSILEPGDGNQPLRSCIGNELAVAPAAGVTALSSRFRLPDGWTVKRRRRRSSLDDRIDKYYYEPGTGRQFRSLKSIQKHLYEMNNRLIRRKPGSERRRSLGALHHRREMQRVSCTPRFKLPDGWVVEEKTRSNGTYAGHTDRYYIEPGTGRRFRSLVSVQRYLAAVDEYSTPLKALTSRPFTPSSSSDSSEEDYSDEDCPLQVLQNLIKAKRKAITSKALKPASHNSTPSQSTSSQEKYVPMEKDNGSVLDSTNPPAKVNWVLTGTGGNLFSPFMGESIVPESVKQKWSEAFTLAVQD